MSDEDDKPTVVLDISALKAELAEKKNVSSAIDQEIEFSVHEESNETPVEDSSAELSLEDELEEEADLLTATKVVFFDYSSEYFGKLVPKLPKDNNELSIITTLPELNKILQSGEPAIIVFHYNAAPKAVNQLSTQIKSKFPSAKTVIVAKGLSDDKAAAHKKSKAGADAYLSIPFSAKNFKETIESIK